MPLWKTGSALAGEPGFLYHGDECCCTRCCHFVNCDESAEFLDLYVDCTAIIVSLLPGDVVEIDGECWEYQGEVACDNDPVGNFGDIYATCDECLCLCAIYINCSDPEDEVRLKRCRPFDVIIGPGDVIKQGGVCYEYDHGTGCLGGEDELLDETKYADCGECLCICARFENCDDAEDTVDLKFCDAAGRALIVGDVIYYAGKCYELTEIITCAGSEAEVTDPDAMADCTECHGDCSACIGPLTSCSGTRTETVDTCGGIFNLNLTMQWSWVGNRFNVAAAFGAAGSITGFIDYTPGSRSCSSPDGTYTDASPNFTVNNVGLCDWSAVSLTVEFVPGGYNITVAGVVNEPPPGGNPDCICTAANITWFVPAT